VKIDLDLGFLAIIIRSMDMYFTYMNIKVYGYEEITPGLRMFFEVMGLERGILFSQIFSAIIIFVIVYSSNLAGESNENKLYTPYSTYKPYYRACFNSTWLNEYINIYLHHGSNAHYDFRTH